VSDDDVPPVAALQSSGARRGSMLVLASAAAGLLAVLGGVALWSQLRDDPPARVARSEVPDPTTAAAPEPDAVEPVEAASPVVVHIESDPPGAHVRVAGAFVCQAPCDASLSELPALLTAELEGYETTERFVRAPAPASVRIVLPQRRTPAPPRRRAPRPSTPTAPEAPPPLLNR
jgi:hypothetical protein